MSKFDTHGGYFAPKDYTRVNAGGTHEENPNGGVQLGVDEQGIPNMLEEGEPVYKDYVFSDNIKASKKFLENNNIPLKYEGQLYSEIADSFFAEAENRPNDPISRNGLDAMLGRIADAQEQQKEDSERRKLERELSKLSPEELQNLEQELMAAQEAAVPQEQVIPEQPVAPAEQVPVEQTDEEAPVEQQVPVMANGGLLRKFDDGGNKNLYQLLDLDKAAQNQVRHDIFDSHSRYAGAIGSGLLAAYNATQRPDRYTDTRVVPFVPTGHINLQNVRYNPVDNNMVKNQIIAQGNSTQRTLRNSGLGPSSSAAILAADNNTTGNIGTGFLQNWQANNQQRNAVVAANNQAEAQRAQFDYGVDSAKQRALAEAQYRNAYNDMMLQRMNYQAEADKYNALSNQINAGLEALSGIGRENFIRNQINTNTALNGYRTLGNGVGAYLPYNCGGLLKKYKK